jgi:hypothetical protein
MATKLKDDQAGKPDAETPTSLPIRCANECPVRI